MLLNIYLKELKDCFRDRRTLLLTVFLPIVMMTGLTLFYDSMLSNDEDTTYTLAVEQSFYSEAEQLFLKTPNIDIHAAADPEQAVADGEAQAALLTDGPFIANIQKGVPASISIIGNSFSENSAYVMSAASTALSAFENTIIAERLQSQGIDQSLIQPFTVEQKEISSEGGAMMMLSLLIPLILALAIGVGAGPAAADLFAGEKERKTMEALLMTPVNRMTMLIAKWLVISTLGIVIGLVTLLVVSLEVAFLTENLREAIHFGNQFPQIIGFALLVTAVYSMFNGALLMLTSIVAKTVKESQSYSAPVMMLSVFPTMFVTNLGVNELTLKHFAIPILNLFSILKELIAGVVNYEHLALMVGTNLLVIAAFITIGRLLFLKDKWVMN
ncbi:ABC transporter permease subunit [Domibacillus sp. DTU_2020_1001157_1_SI_ALB_TIR_016]|uniref:ABC transporter permease n=1 Tax=Domibacillus sp. DTU_2020_1001157_1_SI_ALB_TIR_016 TaxID=3077789 RepID=UPI0028F0E857|nr:ABC transporter permease subunit [Domibacillus sp. DTU_2020_1001157_1_SI_ALB_TIR_016]WNS80434.1 ABC transporter permease subunit [Domibacillus sp. DTU_2020_1001157_1_SI_ALB_TIR_016]